MARLRLEPAVARRLGDYLQGDRRANRSDHWSRYGSLNHVRIEDSCAIINAGAGFDSEYELNFRSPTWRERAAWAWHGLVGKDDLNRHRAAYRALWTEAPPPAHSPHQIIANDYLRRMPFQNVRTYLEVGAGTGYLAALAHQRWGARVTIVNLPAILPLGFLYLHSVFPRATMRLPHEAGQSEFTFLTSADSIPDDSVDLAVNTASFGEMRPEQIAHYLREFRRTISPGGHMFTVNREEKWMDGRPIRFVEYPWSSSDVDLAYDRSPLHAITQPQNPMLLRVCRLAKERVI